MTRRRGLCACGGVADLSLQRRRVRTRFLHSKCLGPVAARFSRTNLRHRAPCPTPQIGAKATKLPPRTCDDAFAPRAHKAARCEADEALSAAGRDGSVAVKAGELPRPRSSATVRGRHLLTRATVCPVECMTCDLKTKCPPDRCACTVVASARRRPRRCRTHSGLNVPSAMQMALRDASNLRRMPPTALELKAVRRAGYGAPD
jgi:hypothetical protein